MQMEEALKRFNNETQRQILGLESGNKALANQTKNLELQKSLVESRTQLTQTQQQNEEARLQNQLKLTGDIVTRATIERQFSGNKWPSFLRTFNYKVGKVFNSETKLLFLIKPTLHQRLS